MGDGSAADNVPAHMLTSILCIRASHFCGHASLSSLSIICHIFSFLSKEIVVAVWLIVYSNG